MFDWRKFVEDVAGASGGDYATGFKLLGFVLFVGKYGPESLLAGEMVSPRTYYRYVELVKAAGWGSLLAEVRVTQAMQDYIKGLVNEQGLPAEVVADRLQKLIPTVEGVGA